MQEHGCHRAGEGGEDVNGVVNNKDAVADQEQTGDKEDGYRCMPSLSRDCVVFRVPVGPPDVDQLDNQAAKDNQRRDHVAEDHWCLVDETFIVKWDAPQKVESELEKNTAWFIFEIYRPLQHTRGVVAIQGGQDELYHCYQNPEDSAQDQTYDHELLVEAAEWIYRGHGLHHRNDSVVENCEDVTQQGRVNVTERDPGRDPDVTIDHTENSRDRSEDLPCSRKQLSS